MNRARCALGAIGVLGGLYGAWLVLSRQDGTDRLVSVALWLAGGALLHDVVLAPFVLALAWATRGMPSAWRRPAIVAVVVVGSLSLLAVPVLGHFGARADNPTLLDRPYGWSWLVLLAATLAAVVLAGFVAARRTSVTETDHQTDHETDHETGDEDPGGGDGRRAGGR